MFSLRLDMDKVNMTKTLSISQAVAEKFRKYNHPEPTRFSNTGPKANTNLYMYISIGITKDIFHIYI